MAQHKFKIWGWSVAAAIALLSPLAPAVAQPPSAPPLLWHPWSNEVFIQARQQNKFVLLDLEAVWCHWCHVMDDVTYRDPAVIRLLQSKYILVKVDQDSRPDLSNRYEDYGWPATVVFNAKGGEIVRRQGYMPPKPMASLLQAIIEDPSPGPSVTPETAVVFSSTSTFSPQLSARLRKDFAVQYDTSQAGWGFGHKYLDGDSVENAMFLALHGDKQAAQQVHDTLHAALHLIDPVWGGSYQYSVDGVWTEPHFEKLIGIQATDMRIYSLAYAQWRDPDYLRAAESIHRYARDFLTAPTGAFYVSQDADLKQGEPSDTYFSLDDRGRRAKGIPRVDTHVYARENGWMIRALCQLYAGTGDASALAEAQRAADWIRANRALPQGGFRHAARDAAGPYLDDTLAMGQAFLSLYEVTGDRHWLDAAEAARRFISLKFSPAAGAAGFDTSVTATDPAYRPHPERDENAQLARFANLLYQYTGNRADRAVAEQSMRYLATPSIALRPMAGGVLLADAEFTTEPTHITVVARKGNAAAQALFHAAIAAPGSYKRIEWRDPTQSAALRDDVHYPSLGRPAAFLCTARACSSPIFSATDLTAKLARALTGRTPAATVTATVRVP